MDSETDGQAPVAVADPAFSPDDDAATLLAKAYQGEVLGEILFGGMAARADDAAQRAKLEVLARLERRTKDAMVPALQRHGVSTEPDPASVHAAQSLVEATATMTWSDIWASTEAITAQFVALYERIGEVDPAEGDIVTLLVAHERALGDFARKELAGEAQGSLAAVEALPHLQGEVVR
ncbi:MAG TPA: hypothetical protein VLZ77_01565 [Acidimicrobiales bacterium]|nr:hypothetical protein [Acidimicrobiales bacterium]